MDIERFREDVAGLRAALAAVGDRLRAEAGGAPADELFEVIGDLQQVVSAAEGAQLVAVAHAAAHETRLTDRGPVEVHHGLGFVDAMAPTEVSLATGIGQWAAGRRVSLAATLAERFPGMLRRVTEGVIAGATAAKVVAACDGLDAAACAGVERALLDRLPDLDPARITTVTRRTARSVAADQVREAQRRNRRDRCVEVSPGPDGSTTWWARLPTGRSAAAWAAVAELGSRYATADPSLTVEQARADALLDLILTDVGVTASLTLGIPVITTSGPDDDAENRVGAVGAVGGQGLEADFSIRAALDGCELPGLGWIDADTVEVLLQTVPLEVGRALLDARTGSLLDVASRAYRPSSAQRSFVTVRDGTCRMWGCSRPAESCDLDHARPHPAGPTSTTNLGALCRRHHRLKQRRRWQYRLDPDGTVTWTSPSGRRRTTLPEHAVVPPTPTGGRPPPAPAPEPGVRAVPPPPF